MRIAIVGAGRLGKSLGTALRASGHHIDYGVRQPAAAGDGTKKLRFSLPACNPQARSPGRHSGAGMKDNETQEMPDLNPLAR
jgi:3-hydroxyisobutyrate dehydrogenase-like beta-hydroxyacid dehydrogenase